MVKYVCVGGGNEFLVGLSIIGYPFTLHVIQERADRERRRGLDRRSAALDKREKSLREREQEVEAHHRFLLRANPDYFDL